MFSVGIVLRSVPMHLLHVGDRSTKLLSHSCVIEVFDSFWCCDADVNECESAPCLNGGTCFDAVNGFTCSCASGYTGSVCESGKRILKL